ncbi:MAG TPA: ankyrin repeat domain-containing protein, partial [Dongiaceae bacterium]|nr:ankyrin repeat domain-containing protein [Dongiaceae bacterium]
MAAHGPWRRLQTRSAGIYKTMTMRTGVGIKLSARMNLRIRARAERSSLPPSPPNGGEGQGEGPELSRHHDIFHASTMKPKLLICLLLLAGLLPLAAQTNDLQTRLQQGLLAEEAAHDLPTAITTYQALAAKFSEDREVAATAVYRLGECYRKLGQTNNAATQYERILREFADVKMLPDLCRQNLAGMGLAARERTSEAANETPSASLVAAVVNQIALRQATEEMNTLKAQIEQLEQASPQEQRKLIQKYYPDSKVASLLKSIAIVEQNPDVQPKFTGTRDWDLDKDRPTNMVQFLNIEVDKEVAVTLTDLRKKYELAQRKVKDLEAQHPEIIATPQSSPDAVPALSEEDQEIARLQQMLQNSPDLINKVPPNDVTPLGKAAASGQLKVAAFLLDHGANVNQPANVDNKSPLYLAAQAGNRAMVDLLLQRGAAINVQIPGGRSESLTGQTPLYVAVNEKYQAVTEVLLANHADANLANSYGLTPLHLAIQNQDMKLVQMLLAAGAQVNQADSNQRTPLSLAVDARSPEMVDLLLAHHATVNVTNAWQGNSPLLYAALYDNLKMVQSLLAAGAQVDAENDSGRTPLSYAAKNRSPEIALVLLKAGANVNGGKLDAPLLAAIAGNNPDTAKVLLEAGADPNAMGDTDISELSEHPQSYNPNFRSGMISPLWLAIRLDRLPLVQLLLQYKADPELTPPNRQAPIFLAL